MLRPIQWQIVMLKAGQEEQLSKDAASSAAQFAMRQEALEETERAQAQVKRKEKSSGASKLAVNDRKRSSDGDNHNSQKKSKKRPTRADDVTGFKGDCEGLDVYA